MNPLIPPGGRISATRLAVMLGTWRQGGSRQGASDLAAAIEMQVLDGQLPLGTRLPPERELADALGSSRTLIGAALDRLREDGLVASRRGAGSWITSPRQQGITPALPESDTLIDLARAAPPAVAGIVPAVDAARVALIDHLGEHGYSDGLPVLRERIAERYAARGLPTSPSQIMITNGAHHGFVLALRMLAGPGDRILVEQPTYPNALDAIRSAHAIAVPVALDAGGTQGWDIAGIEAALRQAAPRFAYVIADFQNPTGLRLDAEGRHRLAAALTRTRTPVVVDETLVELDLDGDPLEGPPPLASFAGDLAISIGSASKSHWGGLRLGWIRASEDLLGRLVASRYSVDLGSPIFEQLILAELLTDPEPSLRKRREDVRALREALIGAVRWYCPDWTFTEPPGGLSLWCRLPEPVSTRLAVAAVNHGVQIAPASRFGVHGGLERWLRLPFAQPADVLFEAVRRLSAAAVSVGGSAKSGLDLPIT
ncbi:DNA-binding transcriptional regulator, MocR family, contains an aminotransferase domain [Amycolatopsis xylanica]|uniref:DNA-binding transcriptional regulator, MocR family, contains an aminotransferase domain n=1 Tax=Amycolatopsis xylanica TaxID=589385 RepID=A0A1H3T1D6_9PSEU|nr:PLP-dependent aminotransferase family protein [Amycolatopsis xylanica]SDZ44086.1 DNA-binding transcriptional regulator, MocR family, contains an aminotransferase domain [Amycolatopsis xylanica]